MYHVATASSKNSDALHVRFHLLAITTGHCDPFSLSLPLSTQRSQQYAEVYRDSKEFDEVVVMCQLPLMNNC